MSRGDVSTLLKSVRWGAVVKTAFIGIVGLLVAAGFGFKTPAQTFARQDTAIAQNTKRIEQMESKQQRTDDHVLIMLKLQCIDRRFTPRDRQLVGLNCDRIFDRGTAAQAGTPRGTP